MIETYRTGYLSSLPRRMVLYESDIYISLGYLSGYLDALKSLPKLGWFHFSNFSDCQAPSTTTSSPSLPSTSPQTLTILNGIAPFSFNLPAFRVTTPPQAELVSISTKPFHTSPSGSNTTIESQSINEVANTTTTTQTPIESIKKED